MCCEAQDQRVHARHHDVAMLMARAVRRRRARGVATHIKSDKCFYQISWGADKPQARRRRNARALGSAPS